MAGVINLSRPWDTHTHRERQSEQREGTTRERRKGRERREKKMKATLTAEWNVRGVVGWKGKGQGTKRKQTEKLY